jgi:hypothetical protein
MLNATTTATLLLAVSVLICLVGLRRSLLPLWTSERSLLWAILGVLAWLTIITAAATAGFFSNFSIMPPRFIWALAPALATVLALAFLPGFHSRNTVAPAEAFIWWQVFRLPVELMLHVLSDTNTFPVELTFEGRNWDILVGITAPLLAFILSRRTVPVWIVYSWNILGLALLANIVIPGIGAVPTPLQFYHTSVPNTALATAPFALLPAFLVPMALLGHLLSIQHTMARHRS